jgi:2-dehydropantoate 2-reductase
MDIVVLGPGAMGSLFGGLVAAAGESVTLVGRSGEHVSAVAEDGLRLVAPDGSERTVEVAATTERSAVADADLVVVFVKSYDTESAVAGVADHLADADVLTLQNGLGNAEAIAAHVPRERVLAGATTHGAVREEPGRVRHAGAGGTTLGRYFAPNDDRVREVAALLSEAGVETTVTAQVRDAVWEKVLANVGINAPTTLARVENGRVAETQSGRRLAERAVGEAARVAAAEGRSVPEDVVERTFEVARATAANHSSMRQDLAAGRRTEVEALYGAVVERAERHDLPAPVNRTLADLVRLAEDGARSDRE